MAAYKNLKSDNEILINLKKMYDADAKIASASAVGVKAECANTKTIPRSYSASNPDTTHISDNVQRKSLPRTETT